MITVEDYNGSGFTVKILVARQSDLIDKIHSRFSSNKQQLTELHGSEAVEQAIRVNQPDQGLCAGLCLIFASMSCDLSQFLLTLESDQTSLQVVLAQALHTNAYLFVCDISNAKRKHTKLPYRKDMSKIFPRETFAHRSLKSTRAILEFTQKRVIPHILKQPSTAEQLCRAKDIFMAISYIIPTGNDIYLLVMEGPVDSHATMLIIENTNICFYDPNCGFYIINMEDKNYHSAIHTLLYNRVSKLYPELSRRYVLTKINLLDKKLASFDAESLEDAEMTV